MTEAKAARLSSLCALVYTKLVLSKEATEVDLVLVPKYVQDEHRIVLKTADGAVYEVTIKEKKGPANA